MSKYLHRFAVAAIVPCCIILVWQILLPDSSSIPLPTEIGSAFTSNTGLLLTQSIETLKPTLIGFLFAVLAAIVLAVTMSIFGRARELVMPLAVFLQVTPKIAFVPLIYLIIDSGLFAKSVIASIIAFFPLLVNVDTGLRQTKRSLSDLIANLNVSRWTAFVYFIGPTLLPWLLAALKLSIIYALLGAITAEFLRPGLGLGQVVLAAEGNLQRPLMFAAVLSAALAGLALWGLASLFEARCLSLMGMKHVRNAATT